MIPSLNRKFKFLITIICEIIYVTCSKWWIKFLEIEFFKKGKSLQKTKPREIFGADVYINISNEFAGKNNHII